MVNLRLISTRNLKSLDMPLKMEGNSVKCIKLRTKWRNFVILVTLNSGYWEHCFRVNKLSISIGRIGVEIKGRNGDGGTMMR